MKRILAFVLVVLMLLPFAGACGQSELKIEETAASETVGETEEKGDAAESETATVTEEKPAEPKPQSPYEQSVTRILIIGNSASNDVFALLDKVFQAQGFGGKSYTLSYLYYSGCTFAQHVNFMKNNSPVYDYYKVSNGTSKTKDTEKTLKYALEDEAWDVIFLHPRGEEDVLHSDLQLELRRKIEAYVDQYVPTEHVFGFHLRAVCPNDPEFYSGNWPVTPPAGYRERMEEYYNFDHSVQFSKGAEAVRTHILTDPTYKYNISTAAAVYYAQERMGIAQTALYRDYTHLSDLGRVIAAYSFYAQFTGEPIEEVKLDAVPAKSRQSRYQSLGDLVLTEDLKHVIKESANYALEHPWDPMTK